MKKVYFNQMQQEVIRTGARDSIVVAGRGTGKGVLHAQTNLRNFQLMPRSTTAFVAPNGKRALTNTLPSMLMHWEAWGYKRDIHWCIGHPPPKSLNWPKPLITPACWDNIISFYTGAIGQIISQDRKGTSNSKSFDFLDIDEAKFIDFEQLKDETFQANRGQTREFGDLPFHHGMLITSDMPVTKKGSWFLHYEKDSDPQLIALIQGLVLQRYKLQQQLLLTTGPTPALKHAMAELDQQLTELRRHAVFYKTYSSLTNMAVLGEDYVRQMKRDLPPLIFQTSILCIPVEIMRDGFYSSMRPAHKYAATDFSYLDSLDYDLQRLAEVDSRMDCDLQPHTPLRIAFDFNSNINWMVVGQPDEGAHRLNVVKSFYVKYERKLPELVGDFCQYYEHFPEKTVVFYFDATARGSNYAVNNEDFEWVIEHEFERRGWTVIPMYLGAPMRHIEKHLLINRGFAGQARLMPYFNEANNEDLLVSIQSAGVYNGKKDKRGEKLAETDEDRLESRTDGSDAFDTLYIGCERFPIEGSIMAVTSNWN